MNFNRVLMGAAIVGCLTTAIITPGVHAQEGNLGSKALPARNEPDGSSVPF